MRKLPSLWQYWRRTLTKPTGPLIKPTRVEAQLYSVALDFLFPLDENASPTPQASSLHWPYLEAIRMDAMHNFLPNGKVLPLF
jgi:hypothetical protein